jgi:hypothetical protein
MQTILVSMVMALLIIYTFTFKYLKSEEYFKYLAYTALINLPLSFAVNALITYIRS